MTQTAVESEMVWVQREEVEPGCCSPGAPQVDVRTTVALDAACTLLRVGAETEYAMSDVVGATLGEGDEVIVQGMGGEDRSGWSVRLIPATREVAQLWTLVVRLLAAGRSVTEKTAVDLYPRRSNPWDECRSAVEARVALEEAEVERCVATLVGDVEREDVEQELGRVNVKTRETLKRVLRARDARSLKETALRCWVNEHMRARVKRGGAELADKEETLASTMAELALSKQNLQLTLEKSTQGLARLAIQHRVHVNRGFVQRWQMRGKSMAFNGWREGCRWRIWARSLAANCARRMSRRTLGRAFAGWASGAALAAQRRRAAMRVVSVMGRGIDAVLMRTVLHDWSEHARSEREERRRIAMLSDFEQERSRLKLEVQASREDHSNEGLTLNAQLTELSSALDASIFERESLMRDSKERMEALEGALDVVKSNARAHAMRGFVARWQKHKLRAACFALIDACTMRKRRKGLVAKCALRMSQRALDEAFRGWKFNANRTAEARRSALRTIAMLVRGREAVLLSTALGHWFTHTRDESEKRSRASMLSEFESEKARLAEEADAIREKLEEERREYASQQSITVMQSATKAKEVRDELESFKRQIKLHNARHFASRWSNARLLAAFSLLRDQCQRKVRARAVSNACVLRMSRRTLGRAFAGWASGAALAAQRRRAAMRVVSVMGRGIDAVLMRTVLHDWSEHARSEREERRRIAMLSDFEQEKIRLVGEVEEMRRKLDDELCVVRQQVAAEAQLALRARQIRNDKVCRNAVNRLAFFALATCFPAWADWASQVAKLKRAARLHADVLLSQCKRGTLHLYFSSWVSTTRLEKAKASWPSVDVGAVMVTHNSPKKPWGAPAPADEPGTGERRRRGGSPIPRYPGKVRRTTPSQVSSPPKGNVGGEWSPMAFIANLLSPSTSPSNADVPPEGLEHGTPNGNGTLYHTPKVADNGTAFVADGTPLSLPSLTPMTDATAKRQPLTPQNEVLAPLLKGGWAAWQGYESTAPAPKPRAGECREVKLQHVQPYAMDR